MMRITVEGLLLFLLPFVAYAVLVALGPQLGWGRRGMFTAPTLGLAACGIGLVVLGLLMLGVFGDRARGSYVPAHIENGNLVPGHLQ